jgi:hypothetical protein
MREGAAPRQAVTIKTRRPGWGDATRRRWEGLSVVVWWCKLSGGKPDESSTRSSPYVIAGTKPHSGDRTALARPKMDACLRRPGFDAFFFFRFCRTRHCKPTCIHGRLDEFQRSTASTVQQEDGQQVPWSRLVAVCLLRGNGHSRTTVWVLHRVSLVHETKMPGPRRSDDEALLPCDSFV